MKFRRWYLIIAAGGRGSRMSGLIPKQFLEINHQPLLLLSVRAITRFVTVEKIIIACHPEYLEKAEKIFHKFPKEVCIVAGGETRFHSVQNALLHISDEEECGVLVHDAARPFPSEETIKNVMLAAEIKGAAVPAVPLKESIRKITVAGSLAVNRNEFRIIQTPQGFALSVLRKSYQTSYREEFTDDASVVEAADYEVAITGGNPENIKITDDTDLLWARWYYDTFFK